MYALSFVENTVDNGARMNLLGLKSHIFFSSDCVVFRLTYKSHFNIGTHRKILNTDNY